MIFLEVQKKPTFAECQNNTIFSTKLYTTAVHTLVFLKTNNVFLYIHIKVKELCERADPTDSGCDPEAWRSGCERSQPRQHVPGCHQLSQQWKRDYGMEKSLKKLSQQSILHIVENP